MWGLKTGEPSLFFYIIYSTSILHINQLLLKANRMFFLQNMVLLINKNFGLYACIIKQKFFNQTFRMRKAKKNEINVKKYHTCVWYFILVIWRCPIFPGRCQPSIFGDEKLNFCVRDENRWAFSLLSPNLVDGLKTITTA